MDQDPRLLPVLMEYVMVSVKQGLIALALTLGLMSGCGGTKHEDIYVGGQPVTLYLVNQSNTLDQNKIPAFLSGINKQLANEFRNAWAINAQVVWQDPPDSTYRSVVIKEDFSSFPNAWHKSLGFHTTGTLAYVDKTECGTDELLTLAISHEVVEMLTNPNVEPTGYEVCDPVYLLRYAYKKGNVTVSDFVYPNFYNPLAPGPYDHTGQVTNSLQPAPGGVLFATAQAMLKLSTWHRGLINN